MVKPAFKQTIAMNSQALDINQLFLNDRQSLTHCILRIVGCPQTAEDLAHEAYLKILHAAETRQINSPRSYLFQIARNLALDYLRKEEVRHRGEARQSREEELVLQLELIPSTAPSVEQQAADRQQVERMLAALSGLSERRRQILVLNKFHQWTYERIARHYGISASAVEKNVQTALGHLLANLDESPF